MSRLVALNILKKVFFDKTSLKDAMSMNHAFSKDAEKSFIAELCYGVCRYYESLSFTLNHLTKKPLKHKDFDIHLLIILGLYQLQFMDIASYAVINETVNVCQKLKKKWATGLVNAVLRNFLRDPTHKQLLEKNINTTYALPDFFIKKLEKQAVNLSELGPALLERAPIYLRVNVQKVSVSDYLLQLKKALVNVKPVEELEECLELISDINVDALPGFHEGLVSIQDISPQWAARILPKDLSYSILDACSAPGGKLCHLLEMGCSNVTGLEISKIRAEKIKDNLRRLDLKADIIIEDARTVAATLLKGKTFDRILLDSPCSASGVIRRHPDIKVIRSADDVAKIVKLQKEIFKGLWLLLKKGGLMLYCTCSLFPEENDMQVEYFLNHFSDISLEPINVPIGIKTAYGLQVIPPDGDGFYYALLKKT